jgi:hypothetical protein
MGAIIVFIITAILLSNDWPAAAKPVPLTACYMALTAATLNLVNELFGKEQGRRRRRRWRGCDRRKKIAGDHAANINLSSQWEGVRATASSHSSGMANRPSVAGTSGTP